MEKIVTNKSMLIFAKLIIIPLLLLAFTSKFWNPVSVIKADIASFQGEYCCLPCGLDCDSMVVNKAGVCDKCHMQLVLKSTITHGNISPSKFCERMAQVGFENIILLDVRTAEEFMGNAEPNFGRLKDAINIPLKELKSRSGELEKYKTKQIVVYCSHSHRSPQASYLLSLNGFEKVSNMSYGMSQWKTLVKDKVCYKKFFIGL